MFKKAVIHICLLCVTSLSGVAQINKHSFGVNINNGIMHMPKVYVGIDSETGSEIIAPAKFPYVFGVGGSYVNSTRNWLAWRTSVNLGVSSRYGDNRELLESYFGNNSFRDFFAELSFGPMFTYQKEDFGVYIGATLDLLYNVTHKTGVTRWGEEFSQYDLFAPYPIPTPSTYIGYWQRIGNVNSPWYFEIMFLRRAERGFQNFIEYYEGLVFYTLNMGFRYELNQ